MSWIWKIRYREDARSWPILLAIAACAAAVAAGMFSFRALPRWFDSVDVLEEKWPTVLVRDSHFSLADSTVDMVSVDLPVGWRVILDPADRLGFEDLTPYTVVVQQGRFLVVRKAGQRFDPTWSLSRGRRLVVDRKVFRKVRLALRLVVLGLALLSFAAAYLTAAVLALVASGVLFLLEFFGLLRAPAAPFFFSTLLLVPFALAYLAAVFFGARVVPALAVTAGAYVLGVASLCALLSRGARESPTSRKQEESG